MAADHHSISQELYLADILPVLWPEISEALFGETSLASSGDVGSERGENVLLNDQKLGELDGRSGLGT